MKIDKRSALHWIALLSFGMQALCGLMLRPFFRKHAILLYGHKLNGNLLAIQQRLPESIFVTMDKAYCKTLKAQGIRCQWACSWGTARLLASATAIISDHGLHSLEPLVPGFRRKNLKFFDVWHGIPFKGFDGADFKLQHNYDEIWVASPLHKSLYTSRYGFEDEQVVITGYARTDTLMQEQSNSASMRNRLNLPAEGPLILFAPTWAQDDDGRSIFPFGQDADTFLQSIASIAERHGATILLRTHINTQDIMEPLPTGVIALPGSQYPDTESLLTISDILICDWSSIAFDYLLLDRPTLFLDTPPPFKKGFSLGPEYRFGAIIKNTESLRQVLDSTLRDPQSYWQEYSVRHNQVRSAIYENWADGKATTRCLERLEVHLASKGESSR